MLAAANASVALPADPLVAGLGLCDCLVLHTASGGLPAPLARATRQWDDEEWDAATERLVARGWLDSHGVVTDAGRAVRERIEAETDQHCAALWAPIGGAGARRFASLIAPNSETFTAAGTFDAVR